MMVFFATDEDKDTNAALQVKLILLHFCHGCACCCLRPEELLSLKSLQTQTIL